MVLVYLSLGEHPHACVSFLSPELHRKGRSSTSYSICLFFGKTNSQRIQGVVLP